MLIIGVNTASIKDMLFANIISEIYKKKEVVFPVLNVKSSHFIFKYIVTFSDFPV